MELIIKYLKSKNQVAYKDALTFMDKYVQKLLDGQETVGALWFLEHPAIYTGGTGSNDNDLLNKDTLPVYKTNRGGKYTYHGPGQRVVYTMIDINKFHDNKPDLKKFVRQLEQWLIEALKLLGIEAYAAKGRVGVWVKSDDGKEEKIAAIGIRVKKWVSFHGISLNISPDIEHFKGIVPCGISEHGVTSLQLLGKLKAIEEVDNALLASFEKVFNCKVDAVNEV
jgi:lipoyl(octanoyl) transferase